MDKTKSWLLGKICFILITSYWYFWTTRRSNFLMEMNLSSIKRNISRYSCSNRNRWSCFTICQFHDADSENSWGMVDPIQRGWSLTNVSIPWKVKWNSRHIFRQLIILIFYQIIYSIIWFYNEYIIHSTYVRWYTVHWFDYRLGQKEKIFPFLS